MYFFKDTTHTGNVVARLFRVTRLYSGQKSRSSGGKNSLFKPSLLTGAHLISPKLYPSYSQYLEKYNKYIDFGKFTTTMFSVTTINHETYDSRHPLLMVTNREGHRYLFGKIPEGTQRVLNENRFRLGKLKGIFLTGKLSEWSQIGGLPGLFLTISDSTKKNIDVFTNSSKILHYIVATWRYFVFRKGVEIKIHEPVPENNLIADSNMVISPIKIDADVDADVDMSHSSNPETQSTITRRLKKLVSLMFPLDTSKVNDPDPMSYNSDPADNDLHTHVSIRDFDILIHDQQSLNYVIRFMPIRGKFDPHKAQQLGIKPGADFRNLTQGLSVTNSDGIEVTPDQVMGAFKHFSKMLILDIPDNLYLNNTISSDQWFDQESGNEPIGLVYHFLGDEIDFELPKYLNFMSKFPPDCQHVISHSSICNNTLVFHTFNINLLKLKALQPQNFNLPYNEPYTPVSSNNVNQLHQLQKYVITPESISYDDSAINSTNWSSIYDENISPLNLPNVTKESTIDTTPLPLHLYNPTMPLKEQVQITTLGTGSALPSIHRNVISNLVRIPFRTANGEIEVKSILLDGGENTLACLMRTFGYDNQHVTIFQELSMIFLSHLHADHHLGLISVINEWFQVNRNNDKTLHLVVPWQYDHFVNEWYKLEANSVDLNRINYISCEDFSKERSPEYKRIAIEEFERNFDDNNVVLENSRDTLKPLNHSGKAKLYQDLGISSLQTCRAIHCYWSYSISVKFNLDPQETFKVSYSGDTRPNLKFIDIGADSDLLIHESSLDNELIEEAIAKKHTTMIEAVNISKFMNCRRLILTHFSTRYSNRANFISDTEELHRLSQELRQYLVKYNGSGTLSNIFQLYNKPHYHDKIDLGDIDIVFAFDMLILQLHQMTHQKQYLEVFKDIFDEEEADEKEAEKQKSKRESKRIARLSKIKKRRVSESESN